MGAIFSFFASLLTLVNTIIGYFKAKKDMEEEVEKARVKADQAMQREAAKAALSAAKEQEENEKRMRDTKETDLETLRKLGEGREL